MGGGRATALTQVPGSHLHVHGLTGRVRHSGGLAEGGRRNWAQGSSNRPPAQPNGPECSFFPLMSQLIKSSEHERDWDWIVEMRGRNLFPSGTFQTPLEASRQHVNATCLAIEFLRNARRFHKVTGKLGAKVQSRGQPASVAEGQTLNTAGLRGHLVPV